MGREAAEAASTLVDVAEEHRNLLRELRGIVARAGEIIAVLEFDLSLGPAREDEDGDGDAAGR